MSELLTSSAGFRSFADKLIDYAGLFPPASLDLETAFTNYLSYTKSPDNWLLSKFIIPAKRLHELYEIAVNMKISGSVPLSVLGSGGNSNVNFLFSLDEDIRKIIDIRSKNISLFKTDTAEFKLPEELVRNGSIKELTELISTVSGIFSKINPGGSSIFFEGIVDDSFDDSLIKVVEAISLSKSSNAIAGFKLRTGGTEASAFPSTIKIASAIITCLEYNVPMKCTAGLHHPIRHFNESVSSVMHGFLNVFGAGIIAYTGDLDEAEIDEILNEEDPYSFIFSEQGLSWNDYSVSVHEIWDARKNFMISYGSCSFDEPVEDLKIMELL